MFEPNPLLVFDEKSHRYTVEGMPMDSVTTFLKQFEEPFDAEKISWYSARKLIREECGFRPKDPDPPEAEIQARALILRTQWDQSRDGAAEHGTNVHYMIEKFFNDGEILYPKTEDFLTSLGQQYDKVYKEYRCEVRVFNKDFRIAGTMDLPLLRNCKQPTMDIEDFKTNLVKGIYFDSISRKEEKWKHYNRFYLKPFEHLEVCNYNNYCLQLSTYAYICELLFKVKIGRLAIRWVKFDAEKEEIEFSALIPVPYLRTDVKQILEARMKPTNKIITSIEANW